MWTLVLFDLPVGTPEERRRATKFRSMLLDEGFLMKQFSAYLRAFPNRASAEAFADRIGKRTPPEGDVAVLFFTDKQYGMTRNYSGAAETDVEEKPPQLALF
ncbi:MAG: CRISPR-associated endonuclease Cas2 [Rhodospirillaceae bacterium]|nr:CRISPR-associated endonuclease Cas2 [Rhodospirillaceae bacterium]